MAQQQKPVNQINKVIIINPEADSINFEDQNQLIMNAVVTDNDKKDLPHLKYKFSQETVFDFEVLEHFSKKIIKLKTYLEPCKESFMQPRGIIIFCHGLNSHSNRFSHLVQYFSINGYICIGFDQRGLPGYIENYKDWVSDIVTLCEKIDEKFEKSIPRFGIGQSLGGATLLLASIQKSEFFRGIIMLAPAIKDKSDYSYFGKKLAVFVSWFAPQIQTQGPSPGKACKNPQFDTTHDELLYKEGMRPGTVNQLLQGMRCAEQKLWEVATPFVVVQGGLDKLVDYRGAFELMQKAKTNDKTLIWVPNGWHALSHEPEIDAVLPFLLSWLNDRNT